MAIELNSPTRANISYIWKNICKEDPDKLLNELEETTTPRLKAMCKTLNLKMGSDKTKTIEILIEAIKNLKEENMVEEEKTEIGDNQMEPPVMQLKIKQEYLDLVPRPSERDYNNTKHSVSQVGLIDEIECLDDGTIVDGHTRFKIMQELNMLPVPSDKIKVLHFNSEDEILLYIFNKNVARRQLNDLAKLEWAQKFMPVIEKIKKEAKKKAAEKISAVKKGEAKKQDKPERTRDKIAKLAGVSPAQQAKFDYVKKYAPELAEEAKTDGKKLGAIHAEVRQMVHAIKEKMPEVIQQVEEGQIKLKDAYEQVKAVHPQVEEKKLGPVGSQVKDIKEFYYDKVLMKKYNGNVTPDEFELMMINALDKRFEKFQESGK